VGGLDGSNPSFTTELKYMKYIATGILSIIIFCLVIGLMLEIISFLIKYILITSSILALILIVVFIGRYIFDKLK
jgi:hypothetical protein